MIHAKRNCRLLNVERERGSSVDLLTAWNMGKYVATLNHLLFCCVFFALLNFILLAALEGIKIKKAEFYGRQQFVINPLLNDNSPVISPSTKLGDKDYLVQILRKAGVKITTNVFKQLPTRTNFTAMYGSRPIIIGTETCSKFRDSTDPQYAFIGPAGCYNTGTNLLYKLLHQYCKMPQRKPPPSTTLDDLATNQNMTKRVRNLLKESLTTGILDDVPWDKHAPANWRSTYRPFFRNVTDIRYENVLPVVTIKDPYFWMDSMCRHPYDATWRRGAGGKCFSFTTELRRMNGLRGRSIDQERSAIPGRTKKRNRGRLKDGNHLYIGYHLRNPDLKRGVWYDNIIGLWNSFYMDYMNLSSPHLLIRYEDLLLHTETVMTEVCNCAGGEVINNENGIHLEEEPAKDPKLHGMSSGLVSAILKYGNPTHRTKLFTENSLHYMKDHLNSETMKAFSYSYPPDDDRNRFHYNGA